jgi:hypothetical protein
VLVAVEVIGINETRVGGIEVCVIELLGQLGATLFQPFFVEAAGMTKPSTTARNSFMPLG